MPPTWTTIPPEEAGFYWVKYDDGGIDILEVCRYASRWAGEKTYTIRLSWRSDRLSPLAESDITKGCIGYSGPIPEPVGDTVPIFYTEEDVRQKRLPIDHHAIIAELKLRTEWRPFITVRNTAEIWRSEHDEMLVPIDSTLGDYYDLCFKCGVELGLIERVWRYNSAPNKRRTTP